MSLHRSLIGAALSLPGVAALFSPLTRGQAVIFMLHRLRDQERGIAGFDPLKLREMLAILRGRRWQIVPLDDLVSQLAANELGSRRIAAITFDDGYLEQAAIAAPILAEFDCPATTFVTTGFLDRQLWFWWDKIEFIFLRTTHRCLRTVLGDTELRYQWESDQSRDQAMTDLTERCKDVPDAEKHESIARIAAAAEVDVPEQPPPEYEPMSWDQLRDCEAGGMVFGPHTVTHPILSQTPVEQVEREIVDSWTRLCAEARRPTPTWAYPNGRWQDFGQREIDLLKRAGLRAAVITEPGFNTPSTVNSEPDGLFKLRRFGAPDNLARVRRVATGVERLKLVLQRTS